MKIYKDMEIKKDITGLVQQIDITGLVQQINIAKKNLVGNCLIIGKCLSSISSQELWKGYGEHLETFDDFLKDIVIPKSTGHHYMRIWDKFGKTAYKVITNSHRGKQGRIIT